MRADRVTRMLDIEIAKMHLDEHCERCGSIDHDSPAELLLFGDVDPPRCELCGRMTDEHGRVAGRRLPTGDVSLHIVQLPSEADLAVLLERVNRRSGA